MWLFRAAALTLSVSLILISTTSNVSAKSACDQSGVMKGQLDIVAFEFLVSPAAIPAIADVELTNNAGLAKIFVYLNNFENVYLDGGPEHCQSGRYGEIFYAVEVEVENESGEKIVGMYPIRLYLDSELATNLGKKCWGYPKIYQAGFAISETTHFLDFSLISIPSDNSESERWNINYSFSIFPGSEVPAEEFIPKETVSNIFTHIEGVLSIHRNKVRREYGAARFLTMKAHTRDDYLLESGIITPFTFPVSNYAVYIKNAKFSGELARPFL